MGAVELAQLAMSLLPLVENVIDRINAIHAATADDPAAAAIWAQNSAAFGAAADRWAALQAKTV